MSLIHEMGIHGQHYFYGIEVHQLSLTQQALLPGVSVSPLMSTP